MEKLQMFCGETAVARFKQCLMSFFENDEDGKMYGVQRNKDQRFEMTPFAGCGAEGVALDLASDAQRLNTYEMIVIDCRDSNGNSWVATYHPRQQVLSIVSE